MFSPKRFPIDLKNPFGYLIAFVLQYAAFWYVHCNIACMISIGFGSFLLLMTLIKDIKDDLHHITKSVKVKANRPQTYKKICDFIKFHAILTQYIIMFNFEKWFRWTKNDFVWFHFSELSMRFQQSISR